MNDLVIVIVALAFFLLAGVLRDSDRDGLAYIVWVMGLMVILTAM